MKGSLTSIFANSLIRKKPIERTAITQTKLDRCLTTLDLTTLGNVILTDLIKISILISFKELAQHLVLVFIFWQETLLLTKLVHQLHYHSL